MTWILGSVSVAIWLLVCTQVVDLCLRAYRVIQPESSTVPVIITTADTEVHDKITEGIKLDERRRLPLQRASTTSTSSTKPQVIVTPASLGRSTTK